MPGSRRPGSGVAFVGIGLIRPMVGSFEVYDGTRRYLVITRHLNAQILSDLGKTFQITDLRLSPQKTAASSVPLRDSAGEELGYLNWPPRLPGAQKPRGRHPRISRQIVVLASGLILLFILVSSAGLYKLARGESQARLVALTDWLSHLPNRRALIENIEKLGAMGDPDTS